MTGNREESRVTIGITSYDRFDMLIESINSVRSQVFSNFNVIIANDNPERNLELDSLGIKNDERFIIVNHESNLGEIATLNSLLHAARTEFFTWLSDDDLMHPLFLGEAVKELDTNKKAVAFYSAFSTGTKWETEEDLLTCNQESAVFDQSIFLPLYASREMRLIGCYGLFRREAILATGGFPQLGTGFSPYSDTILPILVSKYGEVVYVDRPYIFLRTHEGSLSNSSQELQSYVSAQRDFLISIAPFLVNIQRTQRENILTGFFEWFSNDRAGVIRRKKGLFGPLLSQVNQDCYFIRQLKVRNGRKLMLLPSILKRFQMTFRTLIKANLIHHTNQIEA